MKFNEEKTKKVTASMDPTRWMQKNFAFDEEPQVSPFGDEEPEEKLVVDFVKDEKK